MGQVRGGFGDNYRIRGTSGANFAEGKGNLVVAVEQAEVEGFTDEVSRRRSISYSFVPNPRNSAPFNTAAEPNGVFDNYLIPNRRLPSLTTGGAIFRSGASPTYLAAADRQLLIDRPGLNPLLALNVGGSLISRTATAAETAQGTATRPITRVAVPLLFNPDGTIRSMNVGVIAADQVLSATNSIGGDGLDLAPFTALQTNLTRQLATLNGSYEFSPMFRVFAEVLYAKIKGTEPVNQPGFNSNAFGGVSASLGFRTDNPFLSAQAHHAAGHDPQPRSGFDDRQQRPEPLLQPDGGGTLGGLRRQRHAADARRGLRGRRQLRRLPHARRRRARVLHEPHLRRHHRHGAVDLGRRDAALRPGRRRRFRAAEPGLVL